MSTNLNPGADANLINAAYKAAVSSAPADYSKTFERVADSYAKTMQASSEMWKNIGTVTGAIGGEMISNANEFSTAAAKAAAIDSEASATLLKDVYAIKDAQKSLGLLPGIFGSRETKQKKAELKIEQQKLFAEIDGLAASLKNGAEVVGAGLFDINLAGNLRDGEMINAIIKSNLKNKETETGHTAKLGRSEQTGELMYTLYRDNEKVMDGGKVQTMTVKQFNDSIATNVKDGGAFQTKANDFTNRWADIGNKSKDGVWAPEMTQMVLNEIDLLLGDKPIDLKRAINTKIGYSNMSMYDDLTTNEGKYSAGLYSTLLSTTGSTNGQLTGGIVEGIEDTDGVEGISSTELQENDNYKILVANLLGLKDPKVTKEYFKEYTVDKLKAVHNYGYSRREKETKKIPGFFYVGNNRYSNPTTEAGKREKAIVTNIMRSSDSVTINGIRWDFDINTGEYNSGDSYMAKEQLIRNASNMYSINDGELGEYGSSTNPFVLDKSGKTTKPRIKGAYYYNRSKGVVSMYDGKKYIIQNI